MANRPPCRPTDRPAGWPAWCTSLAIHAGLFLILLYTTRQQLVRGAVETPSRDVGIVLKQMTDEGPLFEDEENLESPDTEAAQASSLNDITQNALPTAAEIPPTSNTLPHRTILGIGDSDSIGAADAGAMTRGGAAQRSVGGEATVSLFGIEGVGAKFVYVFDRSISMEGPPLRAAKAQLIESLDSLESIHQMQIIFFNHEPIAWDLTGGQQRIAFATDRNKRLAENFVREISASGGTYRRAALQLALRLRPDVIFFLTDADDPMSESDVSDAIRRATSAGTGINSIEFGVGAATSRENFLRKLARETGGRYAYIDTRQLGK
ncbi:MAG: VWA domain-containing protein [Planctomycetales bacterium]|nr:VWA domain-containing protein [Planctomycetales bacterium]